MRSAEYDRDAVLRNAMEAFRAKGYAKTTMQELVAATGLHPGSLSARGSQGGVSHGQLLALELHGLLTGRARGFQLGVALRLGCREGLAGAGFAHGRFRAFVCGFLGADAFVQIHRIHRAQGLACAHSVPHVHGQVL